MVPWPIGLLAVIFAAVGAASSAAAWQTLAGRGTASLWWSGGWMAVAFSAMCGLVLLRPWGRRVALWGFAGLILTTLAAATERVATGQPLAGLIAAVLAGLQYLGIRYLRRPQIRAWFHASQPTR